MNKSILVWNITQDVKVITTEDGKKLATTSIATNEYYKDKDWEKKQITDYHNIIAFGKTADLLENHVKKWAKVLIEWKSKTRSWEVDDGSKRYMTQVHIERLEFLSSAKKDEITQDDANDVF